ncbi:MAG TPA: nickel pincer cofactor biosynthesis protein LarC [Chloroflexota bacterium]|nr:nickel pincer cofactor biosynthesis protein LarC [Chloroflexota bacterium]
MTRGAYAECFAGASGDMILGALIDAGWPEADFRAALGAVPLGGWEAEVGQVKKGALRATQVRLRVTEPQPERDVGDILPVIEASHLPAPVKARASALFLELAEVEGREHQQPPQTVHFHEVGAVDSILDIVGACAGLHALGIERLYVSPINVGGGTVPTRDGILPVPGPAALELLRRRGAPVYASEYGPEFLTPTGALVLATLADGFGPFPAMRVERVGYGAGQKDFRIPNVLRLSVGTLDAGWRRTPSRLASLASPDSGAATPHSHSPGAQDEDVVVQLETNVDDMSPEWYGHLSERLLAEGALDVSLIPALMKKGRPGTLLSVLVPPEGVEQALGMIFAETTTLGVRVSEVARRTLGRRVVEVETPYGPVRVKLGLLGETVRSAAPEYEDCHAAALRAGVPLRLVYEAASRAAEATGA